MSIQFLVDVCKIGSFKKSVIFVSRNWIIRNVTLSLQVTLFIGGKIQLDKITVSVSFRWANGRDIGNVESFTSSDRRCCALSANIAILRIDGNIRRLRYHYRSPRKSGLICACVLTSGKSIQVTLHRINLTTIANLWTFHTSYKIDIIIKFKCTLQY